MRDQSWSTSLATATSTRTDPWTVQARQQAAAKATRTASVSTAISTHDAALASYLADWTNSNIDAKTLAINARATAIATSSGAKNLANYNFGTNAPVSIGGITGSGTVTGSAQSPFAFVGFGEQEKPNYNFPEYPSEGKTPNRAPSPPDVQVDPSVMAGNFAHPSTRRHLPEHSLTDDALLGTLQGVANLGNAVTDGIIGLPNLVITIPNNVAFGVYAGLGYREDQRTYIPYIPQPDWSKDLVIAEDEATHGWSKFIGGIGIDFLVTSKGIASAAEGATSYFRRLWQAKKVGDEVAEQAARIVDEIPVESLAGKVDSVADDAGALGKLEDINRKEAIVGHLKDGVAREHERLNAINKLPNTYVWRPELADIESALFKLIVGPAKKTPAGQWIGTKFDSMDGGLLEIKHGSSVLDSTYQLRLQTYYYLKNPDKIPGLTFTLQSQRRINPEFEAWLRRWGVIVEPIK